MEKWGTTGMTYYCEIIHHTMLTVALKVKTSLLLLYKFIEKQCSSFAIDRTQEHRIKLLNFEIRNDLLITKQVEAAVIEMKVKGKEVQRELGIEE